MSTEQIIADQQKAIAEIFRISSEKDILCAVISLEDVIEAVAREQGSEEGADILAKEIMDKEGGSIEEWMLREGWQMLRGVIYARVKELLD